MTGRLQLDRLAEVAGQDLAEVLHELDRDGLVEAVAGAEGVADLVGRLLAERRPARVAGDDPGQDEDDRDDPEEDGDAGEQRGG